MKSTKLLLCATSLTLLASALHAQAPATVFTDAFTKQEFAERRARVMAASGDGVAILQGAAEKPAEAPFRQNNQFFYLTGVEVPRAILVIDGKSRQSSLFIPDYTRRERQYGPMLWPNADAPG